VSQDVCPCGQPLHYTNPLAERFVRDMVARLGPTIPVTVEGRTWLVPRHYIALHGLRAADLPHLGFPEG
jgi:hypothetical protein